MTINLPRPDVHGPYVLSGKTPTGRPCTRIETTVTACVSLAFSLDLKNWRIQGKRRGRLVNLLGAD